MHRHTKILLIFLFVVQAFCGLPSAHAAGPWDGRPFESHEQRMRELERQQRQPLLTPPPEVAPAPAPGTPVPTEGACITIRSIKVEGSTLLSSSTLRRLVQPFEGKCLTLGEINEILQRITNAYAERGYVTSRAVLGPQDLSGGELSVRIIEGTVEDITLTPQSTMQQGQLLSIFPWVRGGPLNLRDIEQGLDQLNRLPSNAATMSIEPGEAPGASRVVINNVQSRTWRAVLGYDNYGQETTGIPQYTLGLEKDNFLGCNDQLLFYWTASMPPIHEAFENPWDGTSKSASLLFSIPWGYWLFSGSYSYFDYSSQIYGMNQSYTNAGHTSALKLNVDRVIWRDGVGKLSIGGYFQYRDVENAIEDVLLLGSSYRLSTAGLTASYVRRLWGGVVTLQAERTWGLPFMSQSIPGPISATVPHTNFDKSSGFLSWYLPIAVGGQSFAWTLTAEGQLSEQTLYGSERLYLGSVYTVRGFRGTPIGGDSGGYMRNELAWNVPQSWWAWLSPQVNNMQFFGAWDWGGIVRDAKDPYEWGELQGMALGLRTTGPLSVEASWTHPLSAPDYAWRQPLEDIWNLSIRYTF